MTPHILIQDNDGHWYLIPEAAKESFYRWVTAMEQGTAWAGEGFDSNALGGGPGLLRILKWEEK